MSDESKVPELREQDKWLPIANVYRIMKNSLPKNAKVSKDAKECVQECVSEFVSFITSEASEKCAAEKRKTVNGEDILFAMTLLGFENYAEVLKIYLTKYREYLASDKSKRSSGKPSGSHSQNPEDVDGDGESELYGNDGLDLKDEAYSYSSFEDGQPDDAVMYDDYQGQFTNAEDDQFENEES